MIDKKNSSQSNQTPGGMTKKSAVEKGLDDLGNTATPTQLQKHIKDTYNIDMDIGHISSAKAKILNEARQSKPAVPQPAVSREEAEKAVIPQGNGSPAISLRDIETVKDLVERIGATSLKKLIDVMAR